VIFISSFGLFISSLRPFFPGLERVFCTNIVAKTPVLVVGIPVLEGLERQHQFRGHNPSRSSRWDVKLFFTFYLMFCYSEVLLGSFCVWCSLPIFCSYSKKH
jgi:hypothetical protein